MRVRSSRILKMFYDTSTQCCDTDVFFIEQTRHLFFYELNTATPLHLKWNEVEVEKELSESEIRMKWAWKSGVWVNAEWIESERRVEWV